MQKKTFKIPIGLRTLKTAAAVTLAMILVDLYGATSSKLIFAMLGAMAAVMPTFKESLDSCVSQISGVFLGAVIGILLMALPVSSLIATGIGIILVITLYNALQIRFSPSLSCLIVVLLCTTPNIQPVSYALGRIWDTAIGLGVGMLINMLIFPYDNSRQIRAIAESLDREVIRFLEDMFDGDTILPNAQKMNHNIDDMARQLRIFSDQKFLLNRGRRQQLEKFKICEGKGRELLARMEILSRVNLPGRLNEENRTRLTQCGATIRDERPLLDIQDVDIVTNYHVNQILNLRQELLDVLKKDGTPKKGDSI